MYPNDQSHTMSTSALNKPDIFFMTLLLVATNIKDWLRPYTFSKIKRSSPSPKTRIPPPPTAIVPLPHRDYTVSKKQQVDRRGKLYIYTCIYPHLKLFRARIYVLAKTCCRSKYNTYIIIHDMHKKSIFSPRKNDKPNTSRSEEWFLPPPPPFTEGVYWSIGLSVRLSARPSIHLFDIQSVTRNVLFSKQFLKKRFWFWFCMQWPFTPKPL